MKQDSRSGLRTGALALRAGVNIQTLRFYEKRGLLAEPPRRESGYREYPASTVQLVRFIKRAQGLGFSLEEVKDLLALRNDGETRCADVRVTAEDKIADIESKMKQLDAMRRALTQLVGSCREGRSGHCPLLESLDDEPEDPARLPSTAAVGPRRGKVR